MEAPSMSAVPRRSLLACLLLLSSPPALTDCIGMVTSAGGQSFWQQVREGAAQAADEQGVRLHSRGPARDADAGVQLRLIDKVLSSQCRVLIIAPSGPEIAVHLQALKRKGIDSLYIDRDLGGDAVVAAIATDNFSAGLQAGRQMARLLDGKGRVALLRFNAQVQSTSERERGFLQGAREGGLQIALERYLPLGDEPALARLARELRELDGLFTPSEGTTQEVLGALRRLKSSGKLVHIGFDASPLLVEALRQGELSALMVQQPRQIGYQSVLRAQRLLRGERDGPREVKLAAVYVDRHNLDEIAIQSLLKP
jgi:ribose transport system substrate-binding protein